MEIKVRDLEGKVSDSKLNEVRLIHEIYNIKNKMNRYKKKLLTSSLEIAKKHENIGYLMFEKNNSDIDVTSLIVLSKNEYPVLYRKFINLQEKYLDRVEMLKNV